MERLSISDRYPELGSIIKIGIRDLGYDRYLLLYRHILKLYRSDGRPLSEKELYRREIEVEEAGIRELKIPSRIPPGYRGRSIHSYSVLTLYGVRGDTWIELDRKHLYPIKYYKGRIKVVDESIGYGDIWIRLSMEKPFIGTGERYIKVRIEGSGDIRRIDGKLCIEESIKKGILTGRQVLDVCFRRWIIWNRGVSLREAYSKIPLKPTSDIFYGSPISHDEFNVRPLLKILVYKWGGSPTTLAIPIEWYIKGEGVGRGMEKPPRHDEYILEYFEYYDEGDIYEISLYLLSRGVSLMDEEIEEVLRDLVKEGLLMEISDRGVKKYRRRGFY